MNETYTDLEENKTEEIKKEVDVLRKALKEDKNYYMTWQANIATAFQLEYDKWCSKNNRGLHHFPVHKISNKAAENFLNQLIN